MRSPCGPTARPPFCDSIGGHSLSGSDMLNHRGQLRRPDLPSSFLPEGSLGAGEAVARRGPVTGKQGGGGGIGGRAGWGESPPPPLPRGCSMFFRSISSCLMEERAAPKGGGSPLHSSRCRPPSPWGMEMGGHGRRQPLWLGAVGTTAHAGPDPPRPGGAQATATGGGAGRRSPPLACIG